MATRASIIAWSGVSGLILGLFVDAALVGIWAVVSAAGPSLIPRPMPRWCALLVATVLVALPMATSVLGLLEGRLKAS